MSTLKPIDPAWAWAPYQPDAERPWNLRWAGHLYRRAACGADWGTLQQALREGPQKSIDRLLQPKENVEGFNRGFDQRELAAVGDGSSNELRAWWLRRMLETPHPLLETLTLFWQGYFAINQGRVGGAVLMGSYLREVRRQALGNFGKLLEAVVSHPAVVICLDAKVNRKARPSEFFARTLLEQYTVGPGQFSEAEARDTARALTGWGVVRDELQELTYERDGGPKTIFGQHGAFGRADAVRILLAQPATAKRVVHALFRALISEAEEPAEALLAPLAQSFAKDYQIDKVVATMLRSNLFFSAAAYRQKIKSPVALALGIVKGLEGTAATLRLGGELAGLGEDILHPPTIRGWPGGKSWINRLTLARRARLAQQLFSGAEAYGSNLNLAEAAGKNKITTAAAAQRWVAELYLQSELPAGAGGAGEGLPERLRAAAGAIIAVPEFQLA